jgi:CRP-like cAMP-binding protein
MKNGCNTSETLCASCARAYARPDPAGCAFHRRDYITRELEGHPYSLAKTVDRGHKDAVIIVQECGPYIPSPKEADRLAALARKAERAAMYQAKMDKRDARIFALREQGLTWPEVAKKLKTTVPTVRHAYAKYERLGQEAATC